MHYMHIFTISLVYDAFDSEEDIFQLFKHLKKNVKLKDLEVEIHGSGISILSKYII